MRSKPTTPAGRVLDHGFIAEHTHGFDAFAAAARATTWAAIEAASGLPRADIEAAAEVYATARNTITASMAWG